MALEQTITTPMQRSDWNDYLGNLNGQDVSEQTLAAHKDSNPDFSITPQMLPQIQAEHAAIRTGNAFGDLNADQLQKARLGMSDDFKNATGLSQSYYPTFKKGAEDYGTDLEAYAGGGAPIDPNKPVPRPTSDDPKIIQQYRNSLYRKYGKGSEDVVDMPEYVDQKPGDASDTMGNMAKKIGTKLGLKPEILLASSLIEGAKGIAGDPSEKGEEDWSGDEKYPVSGYVNFGLDTFADAYPGLVKKGYLSKDFQQNFVKSVQSNEKGVKVNSANFKTVDAALEAKAAMIKDLQDQTRQYAQQNGIQLSDRGLDFFTLVGYNGGDGLMKQMMSSYNKGGYLKDDKYIDTRPTDSYKNVHREISKRIVGARILREEKYFD